MHNSPHPLHIAATGGNEMVRAVITAILAACAVSAHAASLEVGAGAARYEPLGNGIWYQEGFEHKLDLQSPAFMVGATGDLTPGVAWHVDYVYLGRASVDSWDTPVDANYAPQNANHCNGACLPLVHVQGAGTVQGIAATLEPHVDLSGWRFGVEAGPFLFFPTWSMSVPNWVAATGNRGNTDWQSTADGNLYWQSGYRPQIGGVVGLSIQRGAWGLSYRHYFDKTQGGAFPAIWRSTDTLMATCAFD